MQTRAPAFFIVCLFACTGDTGRVPIEAPVAEVAAVESSTIGQLRWSRIEGLEVQGWELEPELLEKVNARLEALGLPPVRMSDPRPSGISAANRLAFIEALFHLVIAEVEVVPSRGANVPEREREGVALLRGAVVTETEEQAMMRLFEGLRGLRVVTELRSANPLIEPGLGQLDLGTEYQGSGKRMLFRSTVLRAPDGATVATDSVGRIAPGRYGLSDGTFVRVHAGHRSIVNPEGEAIVLEGRRYRLGWGARRVVGPGDAGALRVTGKASARGGEDLERSVARLVIGADFAPTSAEGHARLVKMGRPAHFLIDFDGTIFQTLDLAVVGAGMPVDEIHIALNNPLIPGGSAWPERHPRRAEMLDFIRSGPDFTMVDGELSALHGYTHEQAWVLGVLTRRLIELFPRLGAGFVWSSDRVGPFVPAERVERPGDGIFLASQLDSKRRDPGPGLELRPLMILVSSEDEPIAPQLEASAMARTILARICGPARRDALWADSRAQIARLRAGSGADVFGEGFPIPWFAVGDHFDTATARLIAALGSEPGATVFDIRSASAEAFASGPVAGFSEEFAAVAAYMQPGTEWFVWKVGDPATPENARVGHGLVRSGEDWYLMPEPWQSP